MSKKNILFVHYGDNWIRGSEKCLIDLVLNLNPEKFNAYVWTNNSSLAAMLKEQDVEVVYGHFTILFGWDSPKFDISNFFSLLKEGKRLIRKLHIDLIHCNSGAPNQWMSHLSKWLQIPLVLHLHSPYQMRDRLSLFFHQAPTIVGVSDYVIERLRTEVEDTTSVRVIANGVEECDDLNTPSLRNLLLIPDDHFLLVSTGSLIKRKGMDLIIQSLKIARKENPKLHLVILGDGPERNDLKSLIGSNNKYIHLFGEVKQASAYFYQGVDAFVSGAREEAFGLVAAEAGMARLPVIAPRIGGLKGVVKHGETGLLYEQGNVKQMARAMLILSKNSDLCYTLGQGGQLRCRSEFSLNRYVADFENLYEENLSKEYQTRNGLGSTIALLITKVYSVFSYKLRQKISYLAANITSKLSNKEVGI